MSVLVFFLGFIGRRVHVDFYDYVYISHPSSSALVGEQFGDDRRMAMTPSESGPVLAPNTSHLNIPRNDNHVPGVQSQNHQFRSAQSEIWYLCNRCGGAAWEAFWPVSFFQTTRYRYPGCWTAPLRLCHPGGGFRS